MPISLEHVDAHLPVTALKTLCLGDARFLILGQGSYAQLIDEDGGNLLAELRTFKRNRIHGLIVLRETQQGQDSGCIRLLAWGDHSLRLIDLIYVKNNQPGKLDVSLIAASAEYLAPDWVLDGCAPLTAAENRAESAYLVTAHNAILGLNVKDDKASKYGETLHLEQLMAGVKSILYSADIISISSSRILIAAGTVFGEIIVWSCFLNENPGSGVTSSIHHFFTGHEGSIFDVQISPVIANLNGVFPGRLLASCSDDRTVRIWDISDCENVSPHDPSAYSTDGFELRRCTGIGKLDDESEATSESCVTSAFGHSARIWGIHFVPTRSGDQSKLNLVSRGEDSHCLIWDLSWEASESQKLEFKLTNINSLRNHSGKHIWSLDMSQTESGAIIYTGGADGAVKLFHLERNKSGEILCPNRNNYMVDSSDSADSKSKQKVPMKSFAFVTADCFLASTTQGEIQLGWVESPDSNDRRIVRETLFFEQDLCPYSIISSISRLGVALIGNDSGLIRLYRHSSKSVFNIAQAGQRPVGLYALDYHPMTSESPERIVFVAAYASPGNADLFFVSLGENSEPCVEKVTLHVSPTFVVNCASLVGDNHQHLALGSRNGCLAVYRIAKTDILEPLLNYREVQSKDGITQITSSAIFNPAGTSTSWFLICARDGSYRVKELEAGEGSEGHITVKTIHHSPATLHFRTDGAYIDTTSKDLMLYGFRGVDFILWNESLQTETARIKCGGSHRTWAFHPSDKRAGDGFLVWAQAGFNAFYIRADSTRILRAGGHGREVKCTGSVQLADGKPLITTGGEDTTLRIYTSDYPHTKGPWGAFRCSRVLVKHDTGPQHIAWSKTGSFMFSSGGFEDFHVWRISSIPFFGLGAAWAASSPKSHPNSELRVMNFDILDVDGERGENDFLICLAYSNSTLKIFHYSPSAQRNGFTLLASGTYTSNCLTQARFLLSEHSLCMITGSTDGYFTLWNLTLVLEPLYFLGSTLRAKRVIDTVSISPKNIACENRYQVHSNSIKALDITRLSDTTTLVLAGGDDNSMTITLLNTNFADSESSGHTGTITIPDAHTASVNSLRIIEQRPSTNEAGAEIIVVSSGNDHQIKIWQINVDLKHTGSLDGIQVQNVLNRYCPVADISSLELVRDEHSVKLLACGVGMEVFKVDLH